MKIRLEVIISTQTLHLFAEGRRRRSYPVSTAKNGVGELRDSERTPRGLHIIRAKIGAGCPLNTVFIGRRPSGEIYTPAIKKAYPERDWVLTRILWLSGLEVNKNRLGNVDTMRRYIYIHGTPDEVTLGVPGSRGCIRMRNKDIIDLFTQVVVGTEVLICS